MPCAVACWARWSIPRLSGWWHSGDSCASGVRHAANRRGVCADQTAVAWLTRSLLLVATGLRHYGVWLVGLALVASVFCSDAPCPLRQRGLALCKMPAAAWFCWLAQSADEVRIPTTLCHAG